MNFSDFRRWSFAWLLVLGLLFAIRPSRAQENPYIVVYDHNLEEPGNLEIEYFSTVGTQLGGPNYHAYWMEFEYGVTAWWTSELYLSGQSTFDDSSVFTGVRWENRFRPFKREHFINAVLYAEFENINGADKIMKEVEGHDVESDFLTPNEESRKEQKHELELKLILSTNYKGWNFAQNTIAAKNLINEPWEFGYALGASRPLALKASSHKCTFCRQNFIAGVEMYGGLGDRYSFGLRNTSHYLGSGVEWNLPQGWTIRVEPTFGLNGFSHQFLMRCGLSYEIPGFARKVEEVFTGRHE